MPLFRRGEWPRDHRDELVAGALVGAVVIVLGYASGIGAPAASGEAATSPTPPPAATAPASPLPAAPGGSGAQDPGAGTGQYPVGNGELPGYGGVGVGYGGVGVDTGYGTGGQAGGTGEAGHPGHQPAPPTGSNSPTPTPSPSGSTPADGDSCQDGEVTLVQPLLGGLTQPVFGLLDGSDETPEPQPSPCVGLAPVSLTGLLGTGASPQPEATP
ncbi:hypothetical protein ABZ027_26450 [Streptomyces sp. NPDC006332]|uniref:hypothetical protein n=1 Tax=Streptomyces sp. NPDC006332 TaxID=3155456 RepID=UPI0033B5BB3D